MSYYADFRDYLDKLEVTGRLRRITRSVDKDRELHPLVKWQYRGLAEEDRFGFLFESVTDRDGRPCNGRVASSVIAANREMYALAMGCAVDELHERWSHALDRLIPPERVATGPVKQEIHKGDGLLEHGGLHEFGIPFATNGWEAFPRVTAASCVTRDPDSGHLNAGMYNSIVLGAGRANVRTARHLRRHWEKCRARGEPLPAAIAVGVPPVLSLVAATNVPQTVSEFDAAGGLIGEAIPVVQCEMSDILVPATAEVVIEGTIPIDIMDLDGPSGENRGHVMPGHWVHAFEVTCITHRRDPIWHDVICQLPPSESSVMRCVNSEGHVTALLRAHGISQVKDVAFHDCGSAKNLCVVRFHDVAGVRTPNSKVWHTLFTVMSADAAWPKIVIGVDDDIDPWDLESVFWAVTNRYQPHRDLKVIQGRSAGLDESVGPRDVSGGMRGYPTSLTSPQGASAMLMDATRKWANPPISLPRRDYMERARELWEELELPPLRPKAPWHGVSLGHWPDAEAELVALSEAGRMDEAAARLLRKSRNLTGDADAD
ncbi:MAG: UbiD family decarboxylase [Deltaproteobacteria bacterium]|nr:UbiD family decarboxylase [Deltaproteobacteria bacterium]